VAIILKPENIAEVVFFVRGEKVMLDADLARLYGVTTGNLNKAVKRNQTRFPGDFMFRLTEKEMESLIFQSGRSKRRGGRRHRPYAFTEQGVSMLSSVLNSERAVQVNIAIMRTFVQLRRLMDTNADLARKIEGLEKKYDEKFAVVFAAIKQLIAPPEPAKKRIGFHSEK
jgi:TATA-box binding protein (TBP) (component of TFIID and TFIIIB)